MRRLLIGVLVFFVITGAFAGIYSFKIRSSEKETNVSQSENDWYPENLRPGATLEDTENNEDNKDAKDKAEEENGNMTELLPDENFKEFEIEEEEQNESQEETSGENTQEPEANTEQEPQSVPQTENSNYEGPTEPGSQIVISIYRVRLRAEPSEEAAVLGVLREGDLGTLVEQGADWSYLNMGAKSGYVHNSCWKANR